MICEQAHLGESRKSLNVNNMDYIRELLKEVNEVDDDPIYKKVIGNTAMILANCEKLLE